MKTDPTVRPERLFSERRDFKHGIAEVEANAPPTWTTVHGYRRQSSTTIVYCNPLGAWISRVRISPRRTR